MNYIKNILLLLLFFSFGIKAAEDHAKKYEIYRSKSSPPRVPKIVISAALDVRQDDLNDLTASNRTPDSLLSPTSERELEHLTAEEIEHLKKALNSKVKDFKLSREDKERLLIKITDFIKDRDRSYNEKYSNRVSPFTYKPGNETMSFITICKKHQHTFFQENIREYLEDHDRKDFHERLCFCRIFEPQNPNLTYREELFEHLKNHAILVGQGNKINIDTDSRLRQMCKESDHKIFTEPIKPWATEVGLNGFSNKLCYCNIFKNYESNAENDIQWEIFWEHLFGKQELKDVAENYADYDWDSATKSCFRYKKLTLKEAFNHHYLEKAKNSGRANAAPERTWNDITKQDMILFRLILLKNLATRSRIKPKGYGTQLGNLRERCDHSNHQYFRDIANICYDIFKFSNKEYKYVKADVCLCSLLNPRHDKISMMNGMELLSLGTSRKTGNRLQRVSESDDSKLFV